MDRHGSNTGMASALQLKCCWSADGGRRGRARPGGLLHCHSRARRNVAACRAPSVTTAHAAACVNAAGKLMLPMHVYQPQSEYEYMQSPFFTCSMK